MLEMKPRSPPDQAVRDRIGTDLDTNLLVEAGAGAGKTTAVLLRMVALILSGRACANELAAVTFTRKAAAELRERFQVSLERALRVARAAGPSDDTDEDERWARLTRALGVEPALAAERLDTALREIDRAFLGTIHAFCARILREHPVSVGLDPAFREVEGAEERRLRRQSWDRYLETLADDDADGILNRLAAVGLRPVQLYSVYERIADHPDVTWPAEEVERPDPTHTRRDLEGLLDRAEAMLPAVEPDKGWDDLQRLIRDLRFRRRVLGWDDSAAFFDALAAVVSGKRKVTQYKWGDSKEAKASAKQLGQDFADFAGETGPARPLLERWWAHRYPVVLELARNAASFYHEFRRRNAVLAYQDLLLLAAELLRTSGAARGELTERYRYVLVDEFQDTDPIQAEVVFLLTAADPDEPDWRQAVPGPGALFVVGDPKQSIYRFRRADIAIYNQVKARFHECGDIVELTANFRSVPEIGRFVNRFFGDGGRFPETATTEQAAFAPVDAVREDAAGYGVFCHEPDGRKRGEIEASDAGRIASWIRERVDVGDRKPSDFLILTARKKSLAAHARALEARNLPVQVTGAAPGVEEELRELILLLRALADPEDGSLTLAALIGLYFGIDHDALAGHVLSGGRISFLGVSDEPGTEVEAALARMNQWWRLARAAPADVAIARIVDELGILPYAAAGELGEMRAGALAYVLDAVRTAGLAGETALSAAIDAIEAALDADEVTAPLDPGRDDAVRVMNLHKGKGLEAPVVFLASPIGDSDHPPKRHIRRPETGEAVGYMEAVTGQGYGRAVLARPLDWEEHATTERAFETAEEDRLLYVAATRPADELVISRADYSWSPSPWQAFHDELENGATRLKLVVAPPPARERLERSAEEIEERIREVDENRRARAAAGFRVLAVTDRVQAAAVPVGADTGTETIAVDTGAAANEGGPSPSSPDEVPAPHGPAWGVAVHGALEAAARGIDRDSLEAVCRDLLIVNDCPRSDAGEPLWLPELLELVDQVRGSEWWLRAQNADRALYEVAFMTRLTADEWCAVARRLGLDDTEATTAEIVEGVIDLAFREPDGWVLVDYKTDDITDEEAETRAVKYRPQLDLYAECWTRLTGEPVKQRALLFTGAGTAVVW